jgi:hypothetical protein
MNWKSIDVKAIINKKNGQINFSLPKKKIGKELIEKANSGKIIKLMFEDN